MSDYREDKEPLVLIGGGGHCRACIDVIEASRSWEIIGILDKQESAGSSVLGYPVLGTDAEIPRLAATGIWFLVAVGQLRSAEIRCRIYDCILGVGGRLATVVSPHAYVSPTATLGRGTIVMHRALVNSAARVGNNVIINTMALLEHDAQVGDHCHISTSSVINGSAVVGEGCFVGSNAVVVQSATIPANSFVPAAFLYK